MKKINLFLELFGLSTITIPIILSSCSKTLTENEKFIKQYDKFLHNYLSSTQNYKIQPVGELADMEWHDQIIDKVVFTTFSTYPNKHFLRIFTTKQRTFNFCVGGNTVDEMNKIISGAHTDCVKQLEDKEHYEGHHLLEKYTINDEYISYEITSTDDKDTTFYLFNIRINKNGYIEKFENTTDTEYLEEHSTEYGCIEVKYIPK